MRFSGGGAELSAEETEPCPERVRGKEEQETESGLFCEDPAVRKGRILRLKKLFISDIPLQHGIHKYYMR